MSDKWTILLTGPSNGLVGSLGESFKNSPCHYERVDVVRADRYDRLREALISCAEQLDDDPDSRCMDNIVSDKAHKLLAELDKDQ